MDCTDGKLNARKRREPVAPCFGGRSEGRRRRNDLRKQSGRFAQSVLEARFLASRAPGWWKV